MKFKRVPIILICILLLNPSVVRAENTKQEKKGSQRILTTALVVTAAALTAAGGYKLLLHLQKIDKGKVARTAAGQSVSTRKTSTRAQKSAQTTAVMDNAEVIERGKALQLQAQTGKEMSAEELQAIYDGRRTELEINKANELQNLDKEHDTQAEIDKAVAKIENNYSYKLMDLEDLYEKVKELSPGTLQQTQYSLEFTKKITKLFDTTGQSEELLKYVKEGNLQEVIWQLDEAGFVDTARRFEHLVRKELETNSALEFVDSHSKLPLNKLGSATFVNNHNAVVFPSGVRGFFKRGGQKELASYHIDRLLNLNVFPVTVAREIRYPAEITASGKEIVTHGSIQLIVEHPTNPLGTLPPSHKYFTYQSFIDAYPTRTADEINLDSQKINTLRLFSMDGDFYGASRNVVFPTKGRTVKIDGEEGLNLGARDPYLKSLRKYTHDYYFAPDFIERLKNLDRREIEQVLQPYAGKKLEETVDVFEDLVDEYLRIAENMKR